MINKKNRYDISINENNRTIDNDKKNKIKRLIEKKNITERTMQIKNKYRNRQNESLDLEKEEDNNSIINTNINKYVKLSKLMKRIKVKKENEIKNCSNKRNNSLEDDSTIKTPKINVTERDELENNTIRIRKINKN